MTRHTHIFRLIISRGESRSFFCISAAISAAVSARGISPHAAAALRASRI